MNTVLEILKDNRIFKGIEVNNLKNILNCLSARVTSYKKNDIILSAGDEVSFVGVVLSGRIKISREDMDGNSNILAVIGYNEIFAETLACAGVKESPITAVAEDDCRVLFLNYKKIVSSCKNACAFHSRLIENMLDIIAKKNLMLNQKIEIISKRTIREKLLTFLEIQRKHSNSKKFKIPYNREVLADYLCVDRSAMSRELGKMRDEGLIEYRKDEFEIVQV